MRRYYIQACDNVHRFRQETASATRIQCRWRCYLARKRVKRRRRIRWRKATKRIQAIWRMKLAVLVKKRLAEARHKQRCNRLAKVVEDLWNIRKARLYRIALQVQRQIALEKRRQWVAILIQRMVRGRQARRFVHQKRYFRKLHFLQRKLAAMKIQKTIRRFVKRKQYLRWRKHKHSVIVIRVNVKIWWRRCKRIKREKTILRHNSATVVQSAVRMMLAKKLLKRLLEEEEERQRRLAELAAIPPPPPSPRKEKIDICVHLSAEAMMIMASKGPVFLLHWCLSNGILRFHQDTGYLPGSVISQVIRSVEVAQQKKFEEIEDVTEDDLESSVMSIEEVESNQILDTNNVGNAAPPVNKEKVITVSKWEKGSVSESPPEDIVPQLWQQHCQCANDMGDEVYFELRENCIEVHILALRLEVRTVSSAISEVDGSIDTEVIKEKVRLDYCIQFLSESTLSYDLSMFKSTKLVSEDELNLVEQMSSVDDAKLRFRDAVVTLYKEKKVVEPPEPVIVEEEEKEEEVPLPQEVESEPEVVEMEEEVFHIILEEEKALTPPPTPPPPSPPKPPPIDYDAIARIIQIAIREWYQCKVNAVIIIQQMYRRCYILTTWHQLVDLMWRRAQKSRLILQCAIRQFIAKCRLSRLQREYAEEHFPFGHDFAEDEVRNWQAFGFDLYNEDLQWNDGLLQSVVALPLPKTAPMLTTNNPFLEIVDMLQLSESIPANCMLLSSEVVLMQTDLFRLVDPKVSVEENKETQIPPPDSGAADLNETSVKNIVEAKQKEDSEEEESDEDEDEEDEDDEDEDEDDDEEDEEEEDTGKSLTADAAPEAQAKEITSQTFEPPKTPKIITMEELVSNHHAPNLAMHLTSQPTTLSDATGLHQIAIVDLDPASVVYQSLHDSFLHTLQLSFNQSKVSNLEKDRDQKMMAVLQASPFYRKIVSKTS